MFKALINGKEVDLNFGLGVSITDFQYGTFDVVGKKNDRSEVEVLRNQIGLIFVMQKGDTEPYILESRGYDFICWLHNLQEVKSHTLETE